MMTTRFRSWWGVSTTAVASSDRVSANIAFMVHLVRALIDGFSKLLSGILALPLLGFATALQHTRNRHFAMRGACSVGGTAMGGSGFTLIRNITKHRAPMTNVTTVKTCFM